MKLQSSLVLLMSVCVMAQTCDKITYRKEVSDVTPDEWKVYLDTIKEAKRRGIWIEAANLHNRLNPQIHWNCVFFFWHRAFLSDMEKKLQAINPNFFFPYWDSPTVTNQVDRSPIWSQIGTVGNPVAGNPFGNDIMATDNGSQQRLFRDIPSVSSLNGKLPNQQLYDQYTSDSLRNGGFAYWAERMEATHGTLHVEVGGNRGQMSNMYSPVDPMFYFHHAHLDYLWVKAQDTWNAANMGAGAQFGGRLSDRRTACTFDARIPNYPQLTLNNVLNTKSICVEYLRRGQPKPTTTTTTTAARTTTTVATTTTKAITTTTAPTTTTTKAQTTTVATTTTTNAATTTIAASTTNAATSVKPDTSSNAATTTSAAGTTNAAATTTSGSAATSNSAATSTSSQSSVANTTTTKGVSTTGTSQSPAATSGSATSNAATGSATASTTATSASTSSASDSSATSTNTNIVIITTGLPSPTFTGVPVIPTDVPRYEYPVDFVPIKSCPSKLPEFWIKMLAGSNDYDFVKARTDLIYKECEELVIKVQEGYKVPPMVDYSYDQRPDIIFTPDECARDSGINGVLAQTNVYDAYGYNGTNTGTYGVASAAVVQSGSLIAFVLAVVSLF